MEIFFKIKKKSLTPIIAILLLNINKALSEKI